MNAPRFLAACLMAALSAPGCSTPSTTDAGDAQPAVDAIADAVTDVAPETAADAGAPAGSRCMRDIDCVAGFECLMGFVEGGLCTRTCRNGTATSERSMCGAGATCVAQGDGTTANGYCEHACDPARALTDCRPGFVCTGWWYSHASGMPDSPGCWTFCTEDAHCPAGGHCDVRRGACEVTPSTPGTRQDGEPCTPVMSGRSAECRGTCFSTDPAEPTHGICGTLINTAVTMRCPDDPTNVMLNGPPGDNIGVCLLRSCATDCDCTAPLLCVPAIAGAAAHLCDYPSATNPGTPCGDAGVTDGGSDASATDASASDATVDGSVDATASDAAAG